ncbi:phosphoribosyl-ATP pyrophosphohydrolase [Candidatus Kinetoplastibacterium blastocrithidii TCC012E]|uniref:Phosphoribosyl-ATP pyrophosphatase n=1 Tax=Candidatus Kinetoplastidibacterium blastocrithidiae TCC012E TaxID=1208922 RepID=M1M2P5_9PROT|nr:phosphoribosyl-ATP diphosphatase [Candidatus Kinetoplastibacterium blastocrithidii]AFZ83371.1 phosphoribosyl-ATP pyrophosphatase [Candidatus Kinetoplastibacterium blastocrithidii (ex Strigomonas culicis)]AGF49469.1 phosphoribosyl-ATP pyrophosphohydrolase [Candidatus Kinetoplastibacterium blastocrithidii TCC012E]
MKILRNTGQEVLSRLADTLKDRKPNENNSLNNNNSYVAKLFTTGPDSFLKKIGEEATELVMAAKDGQSKFIINETADLWFHCIVLLTYYNLRPEDVLSELERREGLSGIEEKSRREKGKDYDD